MNEPRVREGWQLLVAIAATLALVSCGAPSVEEQRERQRAEAADVAAKEDPVPTLATLPRVGVTVANRQAWRPILGWPDTCEDAFAISHAGDDGGVTFHANGPGLSLVRVICAAGSYQPSQVFLRFDERGSSPVAELLEFPVLQTDDGRTVGTAVETELFGETAMTADGRELAVLSLSRQTGDCGIWTRFEIGAVHPTRRDAAAKLPCPATPGDAVTVDAAAPPPGWPRLTPGK